MRCVTLRIRISAKPFGPKPAMMPQHLSWSCRSQKCRKNAIRPATAHVAEATIRFHKRRL